jgi:inward rectifier potassium channel
MVINRVNGKRMLMFRVGNARGNDVVDASVSLAVLLEEVTPEGHHLRRVTDLALVRRRQPMFVLSWTVMHDLDDSSPLGKVDWSQPAGPIIGFIATLRGHDETYGQTTYARHTYTANAVRSGHRFVDILHELEDGRLMVDYTDFHATLPDAEADRNPEAPSTVG